MGEVLTWNFVGKRECESVDESGFDLKSVVSSVDFQAPRNIIVTV